MPVPVAILIAGGRGALPRYGVDWALALRSKGFPWATFAVNVSGSLLLGLLFTVMTERIEVDPAIRYGVTIGFLGGYTTFSTFSLETFRLLDARKIGLALAYSLGSVVAGVLGVWVGVVIARAP
jgi:CrcB protein